MKKTILPLLLLSCGFFFLPGTQAQTIENSINLYGANFPQEKLYLHFDKESYLPGETVWFKAYLFEENLPSERSTNLYTSFYNEQGKLLGQVISPVFGSSSNGQFDLPDTLRAAQVICRSYTSWMMNFDTSFLFSKAIRLVGTNPVKQNDASAKTVALHFFPEGGDLLDGSRNTVAFKANYSNGLPFDVNGVIKKQETGEVLMPLQSTHNGMGRFDIDIEPGQKYYAEWTDNTGKTVQSWLPAAKTTGISLKLTVQKEKLFYNLINKTGNDSLHVIMYMYQKVFYKTNLAVAEAQPHTGMVPLSGLPSGVMQLTVFNASWQPVSERIAFINTGNYLADAGISTSVVSTQKRGKNAWEIMVSDTVPANMSLSVTDADMNALPIENSILSNMLLKGDLRGYVHNPAWYFSTSDPDSRAKLDLVMLTHGWRRYNWTDMVNQRVPAVKNQTDEYLGVYGQISKELLGKLDSDEQVNLIVKTKDSINSYYSVKPDKDGFLRQTGLVFYDSAKVYFSFNKNKANNSQIAFGKYNFTSPPISFISNHRDLLAPDTTGTSPKPGLSLFQYYSSSNGIRKFNEEKTMQGVVVKTNSRRNWRNDPIVKMDERYTSGAFTGGSVGYSFDVAHDEKAWTKLDIFNYIRSVVPGLRVGTFNAAAGRTLTYNDKSVFVYIDEHEMTTTDLENLSLEQVAYVKLIPNFLGRGPEAGSTGINPALAVYTRKGDDLIDRRPTEKDLGSVKVAGYSPVKEFYSPDYTQDNSSGTDARTTLLRAPYILTDKNNRKVPVVFYNNDFSKRFRVILEGVNNEGKLIRIERTIE